MNGETIFKIFCGAVAMVLILMLVCVVFFSTPRGYHLETCSYYGITAHSVKEDIRFHADRRVFTHYDYNETIRVYNMLKED